MTRSEHTTKPLRRARTATGQPTDPPLQPLGHDLLWSWDLADKIKDGGGGSTYLPEIGD